MRSSLPNAFFFGLTGSPINRVDRNTFNTFSSKEDAKGYISKYSFEQSIEDGATKEIHFDPRLPTIHLNNALIDESYYELTGSLSDFEREIISKKATTFGAIIKSENRIKQISQDIALHYKEKVKFNEFGAMIVAYDRETWVLYKKQLDKFLPNNYSEVIMTVNPNELDFSDYNYTLTLYYPT